MAREALDDIVTDGRAVNVIDRIRQLTIKHEREKRPLGINALIDGVVPLVRTELHKHEATLRMALARGLPPVQGDRVQLQQVVIHLVRNGMEAMATVHDRPRELVIRSKAHGGNRVLVAVQDAGVGLDAFHLEKVFSAFFTTMPEGMGRGLSISRSIIEGHGGLLWATANMTHGVTFKFVLPV